MAAMAATTVLPEPTKLQQAQHGLRTPAVVCYIHDHPLLSGGQLKRQAVDKVLSGLRFEFKNRSLPTFVGLFALQQSQMMGQKFFKSQPV